MELHRLAGGDELHRQHPLQAPDRPERLLRGVHPHGDVVLLGRPGGQRSRAGRRRLVTGFGHLARRRHLHHHHPRPEPRLRGQERRQPGEVRVEEPIGAPLAHGRHGRKGGGQVVQGRGHRLAVKVAVGEDGRPSRADVQHERVVGGGVDLHLQHPPHVAEGVPGRPVDLGHAAEGVGVLDPGVPVPVALPDLALLQEGAEATCALPLARMWPGLVDGRVEGHRRPAEPLQGRGPGHLGHLQQFLRTEEGQRPEGRHGLGPVQQGQTLLGLQLERLQPRGGQGLVSREPPSPHRRLALSDEDQRHVGGRREVPRGPDRALPRHDRHHVGLQHRQQLLRHPRADPAPAPGQDVGPQQHHRPTLLGRERVADPAGVAPDQVELELP